MSNASDIKETVQSFELAIDQMTKLRVFITDRRIHYLAEASANTLHEGVSRYWNKHYNLQSGKTKQLALFQGGGDLTLEWSKRKRNGMKVLEPSQNSKNFRSRKGNKRLVSFTFGKPTITGDYQASNTTIHSFPMNWYERDVMLGGWASGTVCRGTHIIKGLLPPIAKAEMDKTTVPMQREITQRWNEMK